MKKQCAHIYCNTEFLEICTITECGYGCLDPLGNDNFMQLDELINVLGDSLVSALKKSRYLSSTSEEMIEFTKLEQDGKANVIHEKWLKNNKERLLFERRLIDERYLQWIENVLRKYNYKNKSAIYKIMQWCSAEMSNNLIIIKSSKHGHIDRWDGTHNDYKITISSSSSPEVIGAAVKYSIARCTGKGADLVAKKLFPDGVPDTFDDYLKSLNLSLN
jgi:hypothetical protein